MILENQIYSKEEFNEYYIKHRWKYPTMRPGQFVFDIAFEIDKDKAVTCLADMPEIDPYYNNTVIHEFINYFFDINNE